MLWVLYASFKISIHPLVFIKNSKRVTICRKFNYLFIWENTFLYVLITAASIFPNLIFYLWPWWAYALGIFCNFTKILTQWFSRKQREIFFLWQLFNYLFFSWGETSPYFLVTIAHIYLAVLFMVLASLYIKLVSFL